MKVEASSSSSGGGPSVALEFAAAVLVRRAGFAPGSRIDPSMSLRHSVEGDIRNGRQFHGRSPIGARVVVRYDRTAAPNSSVVHHVARLPRKHPDLPRVVRSIVLYNPGRPAAKRRTFFTRTFVDCDPSGRLVHVGGRVQGTRTTWSADPISPIARQRDDGHTVSLNSWCHGYRSQYEQGIIEATAGGSG
jgi:hypothetical protein